jgi:hypothetical protein
VKYLLALFLAAPLAFGQTTPNIHLNLPPHGALNWDTQVNQNFTTLDNYLGGVTTFPNSLKVTGNVTAGGFIGNLTGNASGLSANIAESQVTNLQSDLALKVPVTILINGHALSGNIIISASDLTTGTLPRAQLPTLLGSDVPLFTNVLGGTVPASGGGTANFLRADGTWVPAAGMTYGGSVVSSIPFVSSTAGSGALGDSPLTYDGSNLNNAAPFYQNGGYFLQPTGTASISQNFPCNSLTLGISYYNGSPISDGYTLGCFVNPGSTPTTLTTLYGPSTLSPAVASTSVGFLLAQNASLAATSGQNINSPKFKLRGAVWNSTASQLQDWNFQAIVGTGANPTSTLTISCTGTTGQCSLSVPSVTTTSGTPGVQLPAAAFATFPACAAGTEGLEEAVTDSTTATWGATVTGGGTNHIKMYCDGSAWSVEAK